MNYRKKYEDYFNVNLPSDIVVHHIDANRENNSLDNLVAMPRELHSRYHSQKNELFSVLSHADDKYLDLEIIISGIALNNYYLEMMKSFINTYNECWEWLAYKLYLEGKYPVDVLKTYIQEDDYATQF